MRQDLDKLLDAALGAVEPGQAVRRALRVETVDAPVLTVGDGRYPLSQFRRVLVVGAGKASAPMAAAVEDVMADRLPIAGSVTVRRTAYGGRAAIRRAAAHIPWA